MIDEPPSPPRRGSMLLYAASFVLLVVAVIALAASVAGFLESTALLIGSSILSGFALVVAVAGLLTPRRR